MAVRLRVPAMASRGSAERLRQLRGFDRERRYKLLLRL